MTRRRSFLKDSKGFTLIELVMVMIIIGVIATIALPQYSKFVEKAKAVEALNAIGAIKSAQMLYKAENAVGNYATGINRLTYINLPSVAWTYSTSATGGVSFEIVATRNGGAYNGRQINYTFPPGSITEGAWEGTTLIE